MASLWPLYLYFGNLLKYTHAKPLTEACQHIAYIPKVMQLLLTVDVSEFKLIIPRIY